MTSATPHMFQDNAATVATEVAVHQSLVASLRRCLALPVPAENRFARNSRHAGRDLARADDYLLTARMPGRCSAARRPHFMLPPSTSHSADPSLRSFRTLRQEPDARAPLGLG